MHFTAMIGLCCLAATTHLPKVRLVPLETAGDRHMKGMAVFSKCAPALADSIRSAGGITPLRCLESPSGGEILVGFSREGDPVSGYERVALYLTREKRVMEFGAPTFRVSYDAVWSPDSQKVAMTGTYQFVDVGEFYRDQVFVLALSTNRVAQMGEVPGDAFRLAWSPDSKRIVAVVVAKDEDIGDRPHGDAFLVEEGREGAKRLTEGKGVNAPSWSLDGQFIALADDTSRRIRLYSPAGKLVRTVDLDGLCSGTCGEIQQMEWLSDGTLLLRLAGSSGSSLRDAKWFKLYLEDPPSRS